METFATVVFAVLIYASPVIYGVLQWRALRTWRAGWKIAALLPLVLAGILTVWAIVGLMQASNLWPLPLIFGLPVCLAFLVCIAGLRRLLGTT